MSNTAPMADLARQLITLLQPDTPPDRIDASSARLTARLSSNTGGTRKEWADVRSALQGLSRVANIRVQDDVSSAYNKLIHQLEGHRRRGGLVWDEQLPLQTSNLPQHLELAQPTSGRTQAVAEEYLDRPARGAELDPLFREIMAEPFTGEHWDPGFDEEVYEGWTESEGDEEGVSESESEEEIITPVGARVRVRESAREAEAQKRAEAEGRLMAAKLRLGELDGVAYWKTGGGEVPPSEGVRGWQGLSALPALASPALRGKRCERAISASQLQKELLFALAGRPGVMFSFTADGTCFIRRDHPQVSMFSPVALEGILTTFAAHATQAATLRAFVNDSLAPVPSSSRAQPPLNRSETSEAFGEACRSVLHDLGVWVAELEAQLLGPAANATLDGSTSTPLQLEKDFISRFGELFEYLCGFVPLAPTPTLLLNTIHAAIQSPITLPIRPALMRIFIQSATPMWRFIGDWVTRGMPVPESLSSQDIDLALQDADNERSLPAEFFIHRDLDSAWVDEDFWEAGFVVGPEGWPTWIAGAQQDVLEGGKARGLLHSLPSQTGVEINWKPLDELIDPTTQDINTTLSDYLSSICQGNQKLLASVLEWDCGLSEHLRAIDGLSLMRGFDVIDTWADWLFAQMRAGKPWADFHLLTQALRDTIESSRAEWMNAHAVRARTARRSKATLSDIRVDYLVPFPLSQVFTVTTMDLRSDVFTFLLRLMRARKLVPSATAVEGTQLEADDRGEMLLLRRLRHGLFWFLSTLSTWINDVIEIRIAEHRRTIEKGLSFQDLVNLELDHARKLRSFCFLHAETEQAQHHVDAILDLADELHKIVNRTALTTPAESRARRRRSRQQEAELTDDSDDDGIPATDQPDPPLPPATCPRVEHLADQLNTHVRKLRGLVDDLAAQAGAPAATRDLWGMLAFALGEWKEPS